MCCVCISSSINFLLPAAQYFQKCDIDMQHESPNMDTHQESLANFGTPFSVDCSFGAIGFLMLKLRGRQK